MPERRADTWIAEAGARLEYGIFRHDAGEPSMTFASRRRPKRRLPA